MDSSQKKTRKDPLTGEEFTPKSSIQRFANPANQKRYNNLKTSRKRSEINNNLRPLLENEKVLIRILNDKESMIVSRDYLDGAGFNFRYSNGVDRSENKIWQIVLSCKISLVDENGKQFEIKRTYGRDING